MADSMVENVFFSLVPSFCETAASSKYLKQLIDIAEDNTLFSLQKPGKLQDIISHVNASLNSAKQRVEGLVILDKVLEQCVTEVFTQNALSWIRYMMQIFQSHDPPNVQRLACYVCSRLLEVAGDFTSLGRDVASLVPQIISPLLLASSEWMNEACLCINSCITNFAGPCAPLKGKIDALVIEELSHDSVPKEVVRCYALLSRCGGSGNLGVKHTTWWTTQCERSISSLHAIVDLLYEDLITPSKDMANSKTLPLGNVPTSYPQRYHHLAARYDTLISCLQALLSENFPSLVKLPSQDILNLICRTLSVNCKTLTAQASTERLMLAGYIPIIHRQAFSLLADLIKCGKRHLLPHTKTVLTLLIQELVWSHTSPVYGHARPYSELRRTVYDCLSLWFQVTTTFVETTTEELALCDEILHDASMQLDTFKVSPSGAVDSSSKSEPPRKKRRTGYQEITKGISSQRKINRTAGAELASAALETLYWWITAAGARATRKILQNVQQFAISTSLAMFQQRRHPSIPYRDPCCRYQLLRVLLACCLVPHPSVPSPLHCSLGVFCMGLQDHSCMVTRFCLEAQRTLEAIIHPRAPCLRSPVVVTQVLEISPNCIGQDDQSAATDKQENGHHKSPRAFSQHDTCTTGDTGEFPSFTVPRFVLRPDDNDSHSSQRRESDVLPWMPGAGQGISSLTVGDSEQDGNISQTDKMMETTSGEGNIVQESTFVIISDESDEGSEESALGEIKAGQESTFVISDESDNGDEDVQTAEVSESGNKMEDIVSESDNKVVSEHLDTCDIEDTDKKDGEKDTCGDNGEEMTAQTGENAASEEIKEKKTADIQKDEERDGEMLSMLSDFVDVKADSSV